ncbi:hydroxyisourate hydrolase [Planctomonas psychrotolerans]|uniref:hydroxyisourate hydrolase n=1 Tax=Planctomonas psychrotolerans TaxID=2528712 RepID=UPI00123A78F2|nr:hydroxyisourate hydrolase [Planctomonas psychrotolerans]
MSQVTTHVLDTARGLPAAGIDVTLEAEEGDAWTVLGSGTTNTDGRVASLGPDRLAPGNHRMRFDTDAYFSRTGAASFFPEVVLVFRVSDAEQHYHVPVLLSPFGYSTYRGS